MKHKYELIASDPDLKVQGNVFPKGRILLGRSESCDLIIAHDALSSVHAVLEILDDSAIIYDMNSTNGTYVGDEKVISHAIALETSFRLADVEFTFKKHLSTQTELPKVAPKVSDTLPQVEYPLNAEARGVVPEYIFEDKDELYPIFKYESVNRAVEVIILFKEKVFSIDYLPEGNSTYFLSGKADAQDELEFPYLIKNQKVKFLEIHKGSCEVQTIPGFGIVYLGDKKSEGAENASSYELRENDLVKLHNKDIQIYVRNVVAPPKIVAAPIFKRDPEFRNFLFLSVLAIVLVSIGANMMMSPTAAQVENRAHIRLAAILNR
jgi:hypothetical protein